MRRGSRNLIPTILAAEAAIIGLLFVGHFTAPEHDVPQATPTMADAPTTSSRPVPPSVTAALPAPAAVASLTPPSEADPAPAVAARPVEAGDAQAAIAAAALGGLVHPAKPSASEVAAGTVASLEAPDSLDLIQSALWSAEPVAVDPLPWPEASARPAAPAVAVALASEPDTMHEPIPAPIEVTGPVAAPEAVAASVPGPDVAIPPVPPRRPAPPPARGAADAAPVSTVPARVVAVPAADPARPMPSSPDAGTVTIEGRVFACSVLSSALRARFPSCGG
jgi:hypothetical protein